MYKITSEECITKKTLITLIGYRGEGIIEWVGNAGGNVEL